MESAVRGHIENWGDLTDIPLWPRLVAWLLKKYANAEALRAACQGVTTLRQAEAENPADFADRVKAAA